jgi:DNA-binding winged helix-turn-helix (wHTH) protein/tetratricopeptide (TPR) repeat protein
MRSMSMKAEEIFQFGEFQIDARARTVRREKAIVTLNSRSFDVLLYFVQNPGRVLAREEMLKNVWPDAFVDEHSLAQSISVLRRALEEKPGDNDYIVTLPGRGYQFVSPVTVVPPESLSVIPDVAPPSGNASNALLLQRQTIRTSVITEEKEQLSLPIPRRWGSVRLVAAFATAAILLVSVAILGGTWYRRSHRAPKLTERDTIVVADFDNKTGDPVFDDTLKQALTIQMEQSPFLHVLSNDKTAETLKLMNRQAGDRLSPEVAHEVCIRSNSQALLAGSIAVIGDQYLITLRATNCQNGDTLASAEAEADSRNQVLSSLSIVANKLREKLGESGTSVQKFSRPLEQVTTSSLEALQAYTQGRKLEDTRSPDAALPYYKRAVELDPNFAIGYAALSQVYGLLFDGAKQEQNLTKAYQLRDRVSLRERYKIEAQYYNDITGELEKEIVTLAGWAQSYPDDYQPHDQLSAIYLSLGQYDKAISEALASNQNRPTLGGYCSLMTSFAATNRLNEAKSTFQEARRNNFDGIPLRQLRFFVAFLEGDEAGMKEQDAWAMATPVAEAVQLTLHSSIEARRGRFVKAREVMRDAEVQAGRAGAMGIVDVMKIVHGPAEADVGNTDVALQFVKEVWTNHKNTDYVEATVALTFALLGNQSEAQNLIDKMNRESPLGTVVQSYTLPTIRAVVELRSNNPAKAIDLLRVTEPYELAELPMPPNALYPAYVRGLAYLQLGQGRQAAAEFQKLIDHPGVARLHHQGALARLQLGRAQAMMGDKAAALKSYQNFLTLWKDADPDIPIYQQAKAEYARLR